MENRTVKTVIGFAAPFGSGSTTAAKILREWDGYQHVSLSEFIREEWQKGHPRKQPTRARLQELGNEMRRVSGPGVLVRKAIEGLGKPVAGGQKLVVDGIRNLGEIEALREQFGRSFYLFSLECQPSTRWLRVKTVYEKSGLSLIDFSQDNERDRQQEYPYGQQVALCVDKADLLITNDNRTSLSKLGRVLKGYVQLVTGARPRYANASEIFMNLAYSSSHGSKCLKRQVGAAIVDAPPGSMGEVVGLGFNENPIGTFPCVEEPRYGADKRRRKPGRCYRDLVRAESFRQLAAQRGHCPACGSRFKGSFPDVAPWKCPQCSVDLEEFFWPERAMTLCTAVHAEVAALMAAGRRARGGTLYTTTFPCFQCSEKIMQAGIRHIVFTEPYPDIRAAERLDLAGIRVARFEGVRSSRFDEIFTRARPYASNSVNLRRKKR